MTFRKDEEASALIMALVFVTVVSLLIGVTLAFAETSVRFGDQISVSRNNLYTADGAIEMGIRNVQDNKLCSSIPPSLTLNDNSLGEDSSSGLGCYQRAIVPTGSPGGATRPAQAALAMSSDPGEGIVQTSTSGPLKIGGGVFSNSQVIANASDGITADGPVSAVGTCNGEVKATPILDRHCFGDPDPVTPMASAPIYPMAISTVPGPATIPACNSEIDLLPGYYDDASALSKFTDGDDNCDASLVWMEPGTYYFDFGSSASSPCSDPAACVWKVADPGVRVIAGTSSRPSSGVTLPGACSDSDSGVQFVFGGQSRMEITDAQVEVCAPDTLGQRISVYGIPSGTPTTRTATLRPTALDNNGFDLTDNAIDIDGLLSPANVDDSATPTASITLKAYAPSLPPGSRITSAELRVSHYQSASGLLDVSATVTPGNGDPALTPIALRDNCTVTCTEIKGPLSLSAAQLAGAKVTYSITARSGSGSTFGSLDGIWIEVEYEPPSFEGLGGCLVDPTPCPLIKADGAAVVAVHGTVYAPTAALDLDLDDNITAPVFGRGVIARTLQLGVASDANTPPIVDLPAIGPGRALTAVGQSVTDGIVVTGDPLVVDGDVLSRSKVSVTNSDDGPGLIVNGALRAGGPCDIDEIRAQSPPLCADTPTINAQADPGYAPAQPAPDTATPATVPGCGAPGSLVTLSPGFYDDAVALSVLTTGGACAGRVIWFQPGVYYFNFDLDGALGCDTGLEDVCVWNFTDPTVKVVGGTPRGWDPSSPSFTASQVMFPGACKAGRESGVNFVFGGPSRVDVQAGSVELCAGSENTGGQPVVVHGLSQLAPSPLSVWQAQAADITSAIFSPTASARVVDDNLVATASPAGGESKIAFAAGFQPRSGDEIPAGSRISSLKVLVTHRESGVTNPVAVKTPGPGGTLVGALSVCPTLCKQRLDLPGITNPADLDDLGFEYGVTGAGTAYLDGLELEAIFTPPGYQPLSGCSVLPGNDPDACSLIDAGGSAALSIQGIVYAPKAALSATLDQVSTPPFGQGVIARTIALDITPRNLYDGPVVAALQESPGASQEEFRFTAIVKGRPRIRARVAFNGSDEPVIKSWSVLP